MAVRPSKYSKSLVKFNNLIIQLGLFSLLGGCAQTRLEKDQNSADAPYNIARDLQQNWEKNPAIASADYHFALAQAYSSEGKIDRAVEEYRAAMAYDTASATLHAKLAAEYLKKGSNSFAIEECQASLKIDPQSAEVHLLLGGIYSLSGDFSRALDEYDAVLKIDSKNDEAAVFKTQVLAERDRTDEALKFIRGFTQRVNDSAAAYYYLGKLEQAKEHLVEAVAAFRKALNVRPGFGQASLSLGMVFESHKEDAKAIAVYEAQNEEKMDTQVATRLVTLYLKDGKIDAALKLLNTLAVIDPDDLNTQLRIGLLHMQKEDWAKAQGTFESILAKVPDSDKVHYYLAAVFEQLGKTELTLDHLLKISPDSKLFEDANLHAVGLYRKSALKEKALQTLRNAMGKSPENAGFYLVMASMFEDEQKIKDAADALHAGLKIFPDHEKMRYFYGALLEKLGKTDAAVAEMEKILEKSPENADALNFVGYTWTSSGIHLQDAEAMLKRALKIKPNNPFILDSMGWNQFVMGKSESALIYLEKAVALKADEKAILEHLVAVYAKNQMTERAQALKLKIRTLQASESTRSPASASSGAVEEN